jgi:WD40 repeat protein/serine/threonine protein kinase
MNSDSESRNKVKALCNEVLDLDLRERTAFLTAACAGDDQLRREVESLLRHEATVDAFMVKPAWQHVVRDIASVQRESLAGRQLGRYQIHERLGQGGMGEVWRATDQQLKRDVAIKILPPEFSTDPERVRRFELEAYAVSALEHPNIITIHEVGESGGLHFIVTELIEGQTLRDRLAQGPLGWRAAVRIASQLAAGLSVAHAAGIIHRDIKPENVVVQTDGHAKVLDFGIAKWVKAPTKDLFSGSTTGIETRIGATPGTLKYMSPEQAAGESLDQRTDVFSLGLVLYEMITGSHPYRELSDEELIVALQSKDELSPINATDNAIPAALDRILTRALRKDPGERYPSAGEMLLELGELKSLIEVSRQEKGQRVFRARNANQLLTQFAVLYDADKQTRMPLSALWTIWRFADLKRGRLEREAIRKSLVSGVMKIALLMLIVAAATTGVAALKSVNEVWDEKVVRDGHTAAVRRAVFSPDGRLLVSVGEDQQVIVWDFVRRERIKTLTDHTGPVLAVAFAPNGKWFATGSDDRTVIVWDAVKLEKIVTLSDYQGPVGSVAFSPDSQLMVTGSVSYIIWETGSWKKVREVSGLVSYGNQMLLAGNRQLTDNLGRIWDLTTGQLVKKHDPSWEGNWAAISPDFRRRVSVDPNGNVKFVDLTQQKVLSIQHAHHDHGRSAAFSPDGKWIATAAERVILWDAATLTKIGPLEYESIVWSVDFSPDSHWLVSTHGDGAILVWDATQRERIANLREHSGGVRAVAFSPDGKRVATASEDQSVVVWDAERGHKEAVLIGHHTRVTAVSFSPDSQWLASADQDGVVIRWNLGQRSPQLTIDSRLEDDTSYCVAVSPNGRLIATTHGVYRSESGTQVVNLVGPWGAVYSAAFTPDGRRLVCVTDRGTVMLWDTDTWQIVEQQRWSETPLVTLDLSRDGRYLTTGDDGRNVRFGTVEPLRQVTVLGRHDARVKSVAFSPDGTTVASAGDDKTIALWDVSSGKLITRVGMHTSPVYAIAFSPDGRKLISGEHDRTVRMYTRHRTLWGFSLD